MDIPDDMPVRKKQCATCVFKEECEGGILLAPGRREEIRQYVLQGQNQICHHDDNKTICRGGRDFQLLVWSRLGLIAAPTDEALAQAMEQAGITPRAHIAPSSKE